MNYISTKKIKLGHGCLSYEHTLECRKIKSPIIIAHLSDVHLQKTALKRKQFLTYLRELLSQDYTFAVITGDLLDRKMAELEEYKKELSLLAKHKPTYFCLGNHEYSSRELKKINSFLESIGITVLINKRIELKEYCIYGMDDNSPHQFENTTPKKISIVLCHHLDNVSNFNSDLILSGHFHAGELNFKVITGIHYLKWKRHTRNLHNHTLNFRHIQNSLVFVHPGMHTANPLKRRLFTEKEGVVFLKLVP
jgi:predicted MPP superfamily phosphohydrolase